MIQLLALLGIWLLIVVGSFGTIYLISRYSDENGN